MGNTVSSEWSSRRWSSFSPSPSHQMMIESNGRHFILFCCYLDPLLMWFMSDDRNDSRQWWETFQESSSLFFFWWLTWVAVKEEKRWWDHHLFVCCWKWLSEESFGRNVHIGNLFLCLVCKMFIQRWQSSCRLLRWWCLVFLWICFCDSCCCSCDVIRCMIGWCDTLTEKIIAWWKDFPP